MIIHGLILVGGLLAGFILGVLFVEKIFVHAITDIAKKSTAEELVIIKKFIRLIRNKL